jgi:PAS domain S-box-containing protein
LLQFLRDASLKHLFAAVSVIFVIVTLVLGGYAISVNRTQNDSLEWSGGMFQVYNSLQSAQTEIVNARRGARMYLLYGDESGRAQYQQSMGAFDEQMATAVAALHTINESDSAFYLRIDELNAAAANWKANDADPSIALRQKWSGSAGDLQTASLEWAQSPDNQALFAPITDGFRVVTGEAQRHLTDRVEQIARENTRLKDVLVATLGVMTLLAILAVGFLYQEIARPLARLSAAAKGIARGDLTRRTGIRQENEIGIAAASFDTMANQLQRLVANLESAQTELAERGMRLSTMLEGVGDAILIATLTGDIVQANSAATAMLGIEGEDLTGHSVNSFIANTPGMNVGGEYRELEAGPVKRDLTITTLANQRFLTEVTASRIRIDGIWHIVLSIRDISERMRAQEALREQYLTSELSRRVARSVIDAANDVMLFIGLDDRVLFVNRRHRDFFGVNNREIVDRSIDELQEIYARVLKDADPLIEGLCQPLDADTPREPIPLEQEWPAQRELALHVLPVRGPEGEAIGRLCVMRDVSAEREADRMKSDFVSLVSHELRTPLTSIKGYVDLLLEGEAGPLSAEQLGFLEIVAASSTRLVALTNDLLDVSRIEAGHLDLNPIAMEVAPQVRTVLATFWPQIEAKAQHLTIDLPELLPPVQTDQNRFVQVLTNLVSNAHKYTQEGGEITVRVRHEPDVVRFEVIDNGAGLSAEEQQRLFTRFYRARNRSTQKAGGTGLGLAISKSLVEAQGGQVGVSSEPGAGSTFWFTLPVVSGAPLIPTAGHTERLADPVIPASGNGRGPEIATDSPREVRPSNRRVLVVEDEQDIALLLQRYLQRAGYESEIAGSGAEALEKAISYQPGLITLDVALPDMDGFAVLERLRSDERSCSIPVLFVSMLPATERGDLLGAVDYLAKPVNEAHLVARIGAILSGNSERLVLIADDDAATRRFLGERLRRAGYRVVEASDGWEALAIAARQPVGLALLDVRMPNLDGIETLRRLRSQPKTTQLPVVMMTASPGMQDEQVLAIEQLGATLLQGKNLSARDLAGVISQHMLVAELEPVADSAGLDRS